MKAQDNKTIANLGLHLILIIVIATFSSCNVTPDIQDIKEPKIFQQPIPQKFAFTKSESYVWEEIKQPPRPVVSSFSLNKKSSKPFAADGFVRLNTPEIEQPIEWASAEAESIKSDSIPLNFVKSTIKPSAPSLISAPQPESEFNSGFLQLTTAEGLPSNVMKGMIENEDGSKWIISDVGTANGGLFYYDGSHIQTYDIQGIRAMQKDKQGRIWMISWLSDIMVLDIEKSELWTAPLSIRASDLIITESDEVWITSFAKELYVIPDMTHAQKFVLENRCLDLMEGTEGNIWLSCRDKIYIFSAKEKTFRTIILPQENNPLVAFSLAQDRIDNVWLTTNKGLFYISLSADKLVQIPTEKGAHGSPVIDARGQVWSVSNDSLIYILSNDHGSMKTIEKDFAFITYNAGFLHLDSDGNLWIGSRDKGIFIWRANTPLVNYLGTEDGLSDDGVWSLFEDSKKRIWIGTEKGVDLYDPSDQVLYGNVYPDHPLYCSYIDELGNNQTIIAVREKFSIIDEDIGKISYYSFSDDFNSLITSGILHNESELWFTASQGGIYKYNLKTNEAFKLKLENDIFNKTISRYITKDTQGNYWVGTNDGILVIDPLNGKVKTLSTDQGIAHNLCPKIIFKDNTVWVATLGGISILNLSDSTITNLGKAEGLQEQEIFSLIRAKDLIYAGTENGLIKIMPPKLDGEKEWKFEMLGSQFGMRFNDHNEDAGLIASNNFIWHGVTLFEENRNLVEILQNVETIDSVTHKLVMTGVQIMDAPVSFDYQNLDGQIKKVATIVKADIISNENKDVLEGVTWSNTEGIYNIPNKLVIPYDKSLVKFSFANTSSFDRSSIIYKYYLSGKEDVWNITAKPETKNYSNLSAGNYELRVATKTIGNEWSEIESLAFAVSPPWWQTWWAYLAYASLAIAGVRAIVQYRSRQLKRENRLLEEKVTRRTSKLKETIDNLKATQEQLIHSEKMASLGELTAGIAHEIQNPLNFVNNFSEINVELTREMEEEIQNGDYEEVKALSKDIRANEEKIMFHGKRAESIVKGMLQHSRSNSGEKYPTDINALADEYLRLAYHGFRAKDKSFNAKFETEFDNSLKPMMVVPQEIGRVFLNLISNAFHAVRERSMQYKNKGEYEPSVLIKTQKQDSTVIIEIKDNGPGMSEEVKNKIFQPFFTTKPTGEGTGLGLSMSFDIIKSHGGKISVDTKEGEGTNFIIILPIINPNSNK